MKRYRQSLLRVAWIGAIAPCAAVVSLVTTSNALAQSQPRSADTLYLDALQRSAETTDRRAAQIELLSAQSALRLKTIRNERLPSLNGAATAQYLSDVASVSSVLGGGSLPGGIQIPTPYHDQYDVSVTAREPIFDATRARRVAVENAQTAETKARLQAALWQQRQLVNDAFFAIRLYAVQQASIDTSVSDLNSRRVSAQQRVDAGAALASEVLLIDAELVRRRQSRAEVQAQREATVSVLAALVGTNVAPNATLAVRDDSPLLPAVDDASTNKARPEYQTFQRSRETINARALELESRDLPRVSAFGRVGYGRPGLNALGRSFDTYWNAGLQLDWSPLNYGRTNREIQSQKMQAQIVDSDESAFSETIKRAAITQRGQISALEQSLVMDDSIVAIRERVLRETRLRFDEGEMTSADYIVRQTEFLTAQLDRDTRRVRLVEARARYLTTIGREVR